MKELQQVFFALCELEQDSSLPKNVKLTLENVKKFLNEDCELQMKISRALCEIEELTQKSNVQSYTRTQLFNIVSILESL